MYLLSFFFFYLPGAGRISIFLVRTAWLSFNRLLFVEIQLPRANQLVHRLALRDVVGVRLFCNWDYTGKHSVPGLFVFPTLQPSLNKPHPYSRIRCQCGIIGPCLINNNTLDLGGNEVVFEILHICMFRL